EADTKNDLQSLNRKGQRDLYLLLKTQENGKDVWRFPQGSVEKGEFLHVAAHWRLDAEYGRNMDTWIVSRNPIGAHHPPKPIASVEDVKEVSYLFYHQCIHILAGQVRPDSKRYQNFAWMKLVSGQRLENYWLGIKDMLSDF
ncbi:hypothetical protein BU15DRAFT_55893, partial [Melanogaster broomeanus]